MTSPQKIAIAAALAGIMLAGCVPSHSIKKPTRETLAELKPAELSDFPDDVATINTPEQIDYLYVLKDRGLYLSNLNEIKMLDTSSCKVKLVGHRAHFNQPENSVTAISYGLMSGFDTIEIDIMQLGDGSWVLHHDAITGRATGRPDGKRLIVSKTSSRDWSHVLVRDPKSGELIKGQFAPYLSQALDTFSRFARPDQTLNIEVKSNVTESSLLNLDRMVKQAIGNRYIYSSLNLETLEKIRSINPSVYLGFIQKPHNSSVSALRKKTTSKVEYSRFQSEIEWGGRLGQRFYSSTNSDWTSSNNLRLIKQKIGANAGLHLDVRRYSETPNVLKRAHSVGLQVQTYSINGTDYHQSKLASHASKGQEPDAAIVDASPYKICQRMYGAFSPKGQYTPKYSLGKAISGLPADADLDRLTDQTSYIPQGLYIRVDGAITSIKPVASSPNQSRVTMSAPKAIRDEKIDWKTSQPILIKLDTQP